MIKQILRNIKIYKSLLFSNIPDKEYYTPLFSPWNGYGKFKYIYYYIKNYTIVSEDRCYILYSIAKQARKLDREFWECGVYKGGTAMLLKSIAQEKTLRLFDTFEGMPETEKGDIHKAGDFNKTNVENIKKIIKSAKIYKGLIPYTFKGLEDSVISLAHIDVDIYRSVYDCCEFIYPRVVTSGYMIFDDYGFPSCPGARKAVDEFFRDKPEIPLILPTGQAIIIKL